MFDQNKSKSSIEAAAEAAQKVNAMLIAKGKLKPSQLTHNPLPKPRQAQSTNQFFAEVCINDVPAPVRNMLTRGNTQEEISKASSAAVSTRGRYMTEEDKAKHPNEKPLYLSVQGPDQFSVDAAVTRIQSMIESHLTRQDVYKENRFLRQMEGFGLPSSSSLLTRGASGGLLSSRFADASALRLDSGLDASALARLETSSLSRLDTRPMSRLDGGISRLTSARGLSASSLSINTRPSVSSLLLEEKIYVGMEGAPESFSLKDKILGPGGSYLHHIATETGAKVMLRGKGSGHLETSAGLETPEPMHIYLQHERITGLQQAKDLTNNLLHTVREEYQSQMLAMVAPGASLLSTVPFISGSGVITGSTVLTTGIATPSGLQQAILQPSSSGVLLAHATPIISQVALADPMQQQTIITQQPTLLIPPDAAQLSLPPPQLVVPQATAVGVQAATVGVLNSIQAVTQAPEAQELTDEQKLLQLQLAALNEQQMAQHQVAQSALSVQPTQLTVSHAALQPQQHLITAVVSAPQTMLQATAPQNVLRHAVSAPQTLLQQAVSAPQTILHQAVAAPVQMGHTSLPVGQTVLQGPVTQTITPQIGPINVPPPAIHVTGAHLQGHHIRALSATPAAVQTVAAVPLHQQQLQQQQVLPQPVPPIATMAPPGSIQAAAVAPTASSLNYEHYMKREKEKRRFTEEKDNDTAVPDNLLGYQHGPPHLVKLTTPSLSSGALTVTSSTTSVARTGALEPLGREPDPTSGQTKGLLKRATTTSNSAGSLVTKKAKDALSSVAADYCEEDEVKLTDSKLHETVSKCTFNQYSGQPQLYQQQQTSHAATHYTQTSESQYQAPLATQYSTPVQVQQYSTGQAYASAYSLANYPQVTVQFTNEFSQPVATHVPVSSSYSHLQSSSVAYTPASQTQNGTQPFGTVYAAPSYNDVFSATRPRYSAPPYGAQSYYPRSSAPP